jgi:hypothetical protein
VENAFFPNHDMPLADSAVRWHDRLQTTPTLSFQVQKLLSIGLIHQGL